MSVVRSEKIDTRSVLNGDLGDANFTNPRVRQAERARVLAYWPDDLIVPVRDGYLVAPPWRLYVDPTAWKDVIPAQVHAYVRDRLRATGSWPSLDNLRRRFGRVSNHRRPDEMPNQIPLAYDLMNLSA